MHRISAAGGTVEQLTHGGRNLGGFTFSQAFDRMAYTASESTHPAEAFAGGLDGSAEKRLSALNDAWIGEVDAARAERITRIRAHLPS